jgi:hypothetical protein
LDTLAPRFGLRGLTLARFDPDRGPVQIYVTPCLDRYANFKLAIAEYKAAFGTSAVFRADGREFDGSTLNAAERNGDFFFVVREAGGDCPSGCTIEFISVFRIRGDEFEQLTDAQVIADPFLLDLIQSVRKRAGPWRGNLFASPGPSPSPSPAPPAPPVTPAALPATGGRP